MMNLNGRERVDNLNYSTCCLKESLRKYSVVPTVVRVAAEAADIGDYHVVKGSTIMVNLQGER